jgi:hypothetical protein
MAFWHIERYIPLYEALALIHPTVPHVLPLVTLAIAGLSITVLAVHIARRPRPPAIPELAFLLTSLLLFHPYLWVREPNLATLSMLMGHFVQYLAIVWLLNARKYGQSTGSGHERLLGRVSAKPALVILLVVGSGAAVFLVDQASRVLGVPGAYAIAWNALVLVHFYLDGLMWAFKKPFVRQSIGPYLTPASHVAER